MTCVDDPSSEFASGLLQHSRVTTLVDALTSDSSLGKHGVVGQDALLNIAAHVTRQMTEMSSLNYAAFGDLGFVSLACLLVSLVIIIGCLTAFLLGRQSPPSIFDEKPIYTQEETSSRLDLSTTISRATILASPQDGQGLLLTARTSLQRDTSLTQGIDIMDNAGLHLLHFRPGPPPGMTTHGACCTLHVGAGGPLLATVEVGGGRAVFRDNKGAAIGKLEAMGPESYALDGLSSCRAFLGGVFKVNAVTISANGGLLASMEIPTSFPGSSRPADPGVVVCVGPGVDAGLVLCAMLASDWLESALQGCRPRAPWGCAFPTYFRHRLELVVEKEND